MTELRENVARTRDGYLPRQLHTRGDRLAFSNGILLLAGFAIVLIVAFSASPTRLIQLYIVGVFVSFVNSQIGMIRHWNRNLPLTQEPARRRQMKRSRVINSIGAVVTSLVLVIIQFVIGRSQRRAGRNAVSYFGVDGALEVHGGALDER